MATEVFVIGGLNIGFLLGALFAGIAFLAFAIVAIVASNRNNKYGEEE